MTVRCDRCGEAFDSSSAYAVVGWRAGKGDDKGPGRSGILCPSCTEKLNRWFKEVSA